MPAERIVVMQYRLVDNIVLDSSTHTLLRDGKPLRLTHIEFGLLVYLAEHADCVCSRDDIILHVWGHHFQYDTGTLDVHLHSLRRKLGFQSSYPIESIRSVGIILHTKPKRQLHTLNIQSVVTEWIIAHESDFAIKQLTPRLQLDPFVSEITISPDDLRNMLDGILQVLLSICHPGVIYIKSHLGSRYFSLSLEVNGTINELRIPLMG